MGKRKSVRGCIVDANLSVLNLVIIKKGEGEIPGLTDTTVPRRLGPKRARKIQRLITPVVLQRKRHRLAVKRNRIQKKREDSAEYSKLLALRMKEAKERKLERRRSHSHSRSSMRE